MVLRERQPGRRQQSGGGGRSTQDNGSINISILWPHPDGEYHVNLSHRQLCLPWSKPPLQSMLLLPKYPPLLKLLAPDLSPGTEHSSLARKHGSPLALAHDHLKSPIYKSNTAQQKYRNLLSEGGIVSSYPHLTFSPVDHRPVNPADPSNVSRLGVSAMSVVVLLASGQ